MANRQKLPGIDDLRRLRRKHTIREIAEMYGAAEITVTKALQAGGLTRPQPRYVDEIPWVVHAPDRWEYPVRMLRLAARRARGDELTGENNRMLDKWLAEIRAANVVVDYSDNYPPNPASPLRGHWAYVPREPRDGDGLIRRPEPEKA